MSCSLWVLLRAPFVGLVANPNVVVQRTSSISRNYDRADIAAAEVVGYEGILRRGGRLPLVSMAELRMRDGRRIFVLEVSGSRRSVAKRLDPLRVPPAP